MAGFFLVFCETEKEKAASTPRANDLPVLP